MEKMDRLKFFCLGVVATLLAGTFVTPAMADTIDAAFNRLNIKVNGVQIASAGDSFTLSNGAVVPYSILYQGTTYLPLSKLAEALNAEARWDASTSTAVITGGVERRYPNTPYDTFTEVTGTPLEAYFKNDGTEVYIYRLLSGETDNAIQYILYLQDIGFSIFDSTTSLEDFSNTYMLVKDLDVFFVTCYFDVGEVWVSYLAG